MFGKQKADSTTVALWSILVSVVLAIASHFAAWAIDRDDANDAAIATEIAGKIKELNKTLDLISEMRLVHSDIKKECKYFPERLHDKKFLLEASKRRNKIGYELVTAAGMITFYFGEQVRAEMNALNDYDASVRTETICAKNSDVDQEYFVRQTKITKLASELIKQERSKI